MPDLSGYLSLRSLPGHKGIVVNLVVLGAQASRDDQAAEQNSTYWSSHEIELLLSNQSTGVATVKPDTIAERRHFMPLPAKLRSTLDGFRQLPGSRCNLQDSTRGEGPRGVYCTRLGRAECQDCAAASTTIRR